MKMTLGVSDELVKIFLKVGANGIQHSPSSPDVRI